MKITFPDQRIAEHFNNIRTLCTTYGADNAQRIRRRLDDLQAASNLAEMRTLFGGRLHPLHGTYAGLFALDLKHPKRLLFRPAHDPLPLTADGGLIWDEITIICLLRVEDYHG